MNFENISEEQRKWIEEKLTDEQKEQLYACDSMEAAMSYIKSLNIELDDDDLDNVAGGWSPTAHCPVCGQLGAEVGFSGKYYCSHCQRWFTKE